MELTYLKDFLSAYQLSRFQRNLKIIKVKNMEEKRLFFGISIEAPWPQELPSGRMLKEENRHITLAFLGNIDFEAFQTHLKNCPLPSFPLGFVGFFDKILFLPERHPNVVAWHLKWMEENQPLVDYQKTLVEWLKSIDFIPRGSDREFLPHVTLSRKPFDLKAWKKAFHPLPFQTHALHLFESVGNLEYIPCWSHHILPPFKELEHTGDIAFQIFAKDLQQLFLHAQIALAWKFPPLLNYLSTGYVSSLEEIVKLLNKTITQSDSEGGCPLKAVSYHGDFLPYSDEIKNWEMIVDV